MTVEVNYEIAIATLRDWFKNLTPIFNQWEAKPIAPLHIVLHTLFFSALNCDWFVAPFASVLIGRSNYFGIGLSKPPY